MEDKVQEHRGDSKKLWKDLRLLGYSNKGEQKNSICLQENETIIFESSEIATRFNDFFTNIASKLVASGLFNSDRVTEFYSSKGVQPVRKIYYRTKEENL